MRPIKSRTAGLLAALALLGAVPAASVEASSSPVPPQAIAAKSCSGSYTHAVVPGGAHKCLRVGQFCSRTRSYQRVYRSKGFYCKSNRHLGYS